MVKLELDGQCLEFHEASAVGYTYSLVWMPFDSSLLLHSRNACPLSMANVAVIRVETLWPPRGVEMTSFSSSRLHHGLYAMGAEVRGVLENWREPCVSLYFIYKFLT